MTTGRRRLGDKRLGDERLGYVGSRRLRGAQGTVRLRLEPLEVRRMLAGLYDCQAFASDFSTSPSLSLPAELSTVIATAPNANHAFSTQAPVPFADAWWTIEADGEDDSDVSNADYSLPEDALPGRILGALQFLNSEEEGRYRILSDDSRFSIEQGSLVFSGGELDHETEPWIRFELTLIDDAAQTLTKRQIAIQVLDVNERPLSLRLNGGQVPEHEPGAIVGDLQVDDQDGATNFAFYIFDDRFVLTGNQLRLRDSIELDYESEPEVMLAVAATDGNHEIFATVRIEVLDRDERSNSTGYLTLDPRLLTELISGAAVGTVGIVEPKDSSYTFSVSDPRFEIVGNHLKLVDGQQANGEREPSISLSITAIGDAGDTISGSFKITVVLHRSLHHNYNLPQDVNGDGYISPIDALIVINDINSKGAHPIPIGVGEGEPPLHRLDVNGDGLITPMDVLLIINYLNERVAGHPTQIDLGNLLVPLESVDDPEEPIESIQPGTAEGLWALSDWSETRRRRENAAIDSQLEQLLDELT